MDRLNRIAPALLILIFSLVIFFACSENNPSGSQDDTPSGNDTIDPGDTTGDTSVLGPMLYISQPEFDFGYTYQNSKISHTFWLRSAGDDTLKIVKVVPGWGCTKAPLEKAELAPDDSTGLEIIFSTKTYYGSITKRPAIYTNEPAPDSTHLVTIRANVVTRPDSTYPIVITPYKFDISQFGPILRKDLSFGIENVSDETIEISIVEYPDSLFTITLPATVAADSSINGNIELTPFAYDQEFEESITFQLNDMAVSRFTVGIIRVIAEAGR